MLILAGAIFRLDLLVYGVAAFPFIAVLFLFGIALGIIASALVLRLGPSAEWFIWPIPALISPFAGVFYPLDVLPEWMQFVARCLPPAYVFENLRSLVKGGAVSPERWLTGQHARHRVHSSRLFDLHANVPDSGPDGPDRPLQCGERQLAGRPMQCGTASGGRSRSSSCSVFFE